MTDRTDDDIVDAWIALQYAERGSVSYDQNFWAHMSLDEVIDGNRERCWKIIGEIKSRDGSDFILSNLAAGPVEDLLSRYGEDVIERVENDAKRDGRLKFLLGLVWKNNIPDDVWERIQRIVK